MFDVFLDLVILAYLIAISFDFYAVKCLIYICVVLFPCFAKWKSSFIKN